MGGRGGGAKLGRVSKQLHNSSTMYLIFWTVLPVNLSRNPFATLASICIARIHRCSWLVIVAEDSMRLSHFNP